MFAKLAVTRAEKFSDVIYQKRTVHSAHLHQQTVLLQLQYLFAHPKL